MVERVYTEQEIRGLLSEPKVLPANWRDRRTMQWSTSARTKNRRRRIEIRREAPRAGSLAIIVDQHMERPMRFSVVLALRPSAARTFINLLRLDGPHGLHRNALEPKERPFKNKCHIHQITERYQRDGRYQPEHYARPTKSFWSVDSALDFLVSRYGFRVETHDAAGQMTFHFDEAAT